MIKVSIQVEGLDKVKKKFTIMPRKVGQAISKAIKESAFIIEGEAKTALTIGPTRAIKTGTLRSQNTVRELSDIRASIYPLVQYAVLVHEGTKRMRPRPWMEVAAKEATPRVQEIFDNAVEEILKD